MGVNSLPKTVTRQRRDCDLNPVPSMPESSTLTTRGVVIMEHWRAGSHCSSVPQQRGQMRAVPRCQHTYIAEARFVLLCFHPSIRWDRRHYVCLLSVRLCVRVCVFRGAAISDLLAVDF